MELPDSIEQEIVDYLRLELCEEDDDPDASKKSDLKYVGSRQKGRGTVHFWEFLWRSRKRWVTATLTKAGHSLSTSSEGPNGETIDEADMLKVLLIEITSAETGERALPTISIPLEGDEDAWSVETPVALPSGDVYTFYAEVYLSADEPPDVSVQILQDDEELVSLRCHSGVVFSGQLGKFRYQIRLGTGRWEQ